MKKIVICSVLLLCIALLSACASQPSETPTDAAQTISETQTAEADTGTLPAIQTEPTVSETATEAESLAPETLTKPAPALPAKVTVALADDLSGVPDGQKVVADASEPSVQLVFTTDKPVRNVRVLSLMMTDFDEETGKPVYDVRTIETLDALTPQDPLLVTTVFYGDLPNNGIAYTDTDGRERSFAVEMSGKDGSLLLTAF